MNHWGRWNNPVSQITNNEGRIAFSEAKGYFSFFLILTFTYILKTWKKETARLFYAKRSLGDTH